MAGDIKENEAKKSAPQSPKGTRDILGQDFFTLFGFMEKAAEIALYYGFRPIETPAFEKEGLFHPVGEDTDIITKQMYTMKTKGGDRLALRPEGTAAVMRAYLEHGMHTLPQPVQFYYHGPFFRHESPQAGRWRQFYQFGLEVIGSEKSITDAMIIKICTSILEEAGVQDLLVEINSLGDKDTRANYKKALLAYFKKHTSKLSPDLRELLKTNPLRILDSKDPSVTDIKKEAPEAIDYLSGSAKEHFKEVVEYLEALAIPYKITGTLVRGLDYYSRTVFEIVARAEGGTTPALASGGRYDGLARAIGGKKDTPAAGGAIGIDRVLSLGYGSHLTPRVVKKPKIFFIQLGFEAKLKSIAVTEILRRARLPVELSLSKDTLSVQLGTAERTKIPWVIILGQKEALEDSVIVRNMEDRSQKTVRIKELAEYLKKTVAK